MPRHFPFPLSIGTDICHIPRIRNLILKNQGQAAISFAKKILTPQEWRRYRSRVEDPIAYWKSTIRAPANLIPAGIRNSKSERSGESDKVELARSEAAEEGILEVVMPLSETGTQKTAENRITAAARFLAGRFAAKEAIIKAHHTRRLTYQDIKILTNPDESTGTSPPYALIKSLNKEWTNDSQIIPISISHDGDYATATCIAHEKHLGGLSFAASKEVTKQAKAERSTVHEERIKQNTAYIEELKEIAQEELLEMHSQEIQTMLEKETVIQALLQEIYQTAQKPNLVKILQIDNLPLTCNDDDITIPSLESNPLKSMRGWICKKNGTSLGFGFVALGVRTEVVEGLSKVHEKIMDRFPKADPQYRIGMLKQFMMTGSDEERGVLRQMGLNRTRVLDLQKVLGQGRKGGGNGEGGQV